MSVMYSFHGCEVSSAKSEHDIIGYNFPLRIHISFKFVSQHYERGNFTLFQFLVPIFKNHLTVTLQKFTIFIMLILIRFELHICSTQWSYLQNAIVIDC